MRERLTEHDLTFLRQLAQDPDRLLAGDEISEEYSHDELSGTAGWPQAVFRAKNVAEVSAVMRYANEHAIPVTPRGAGTGLVGAAVAVAGGILLDLSLMNQVLELDEDNLTLTVEPGVLLMDLAAYVEERGFFTRRTLAKNQPRSAGTSARTPAVCAPSNTASHAIMCARWRLYCPTG